jgi:di/tripeptidase
MTSGSWDAGTTGTSGTTGSTSMGETPSSTASLELEVRDEQVITGLTLELTREQTEEITRALTKSAEQHGVAALRVEYVSEGGYATWRVWAGSPEGVSTASTTEA